MVLTISSLTDKLTSDKMARWSLLVIVGHNRILKEQENVLSGSAVAGDVGKASSSSRSFVTFRQALSVYLMVIFLRI